MTSTDQSGDVDLLDPKSRSKNTLKLENVSSLPQSHTNKT